MDLFPRSFLLVFAQLSVGGFLVLSIPPFHDIQRGYYKSSGFVYLLFGVLAFVGRMALYFPSDEAGTLHASELVTWGIFVAAATAYWATLWGERFVLRARLFLATWLSGLVGLTLAALSYCNPTMRVFEAILYPLSFYLSAAVLGAASAGMLLGHWYLIDRDLSLAPLQTILKLYSGTLMLQSVLLVFGGLLFAFAGTSDLRAGVQLLLGSHLPAFISRVLISPIGAGILALMIRRTLEIPQTMAATGLFYIAILAVLVGEFLGRYLLFRSGLPL